MKALGRATASAALAALALALLPAAGLLAAGTAAAAPTATVGAAAEGGPRTDWPVTGVQCGWDVRTTPPTVRQGSRGATVREAQCLLDFWGVPVSWSDAEAEGAFGEATADATRRFQRQRGLTPDGIVGAETWAQLRMGPF
ncbi:peptidoglycan-binding protein [Streptomyces sp. NPDC059917]|uniref:peptidoglycan-binding domain-containing protein n=1 Tax=Streptomyces sp. NPDC059917 TaxID=3347002 RepID=UPI00365D3941